MQNHQQEQQPQPSQPPPTNASQTYHSLHSIAHAFIAAQSQVQSLPSPQSHPTINFSLLRPLCTLTFTHTWGHAYSLSHSLSSSGPSAPTLQETLTYDGFIAHLQRMIPGLDSWRAEVTDTVVDEVRKVVVLRVGFWMGVRIGEGGGGEKVGEEENVETVLNDLVWVLEMERDSDEQGDGGFKINKSIEFLDGIATARIKELMMKKKEKKKKQKTDKA